MQTHQGLAQYELWPTKKKKQKNQPNFLPTKICIVCVHNIICYTIFHTMQFKPQINK